MVKKLLTYFLLTLTLFLNFVFFINPIHSFAQTVTPTPTPDNSSAISSLQQQISDLESKISNLQSQEKTLSNQIKVMDSQIQITQLRINATQQQINDLTLNIDTANKKVSDIQASLNNLTNVLLNKVVATYEVGSIQPVQILLTSGNVGNFLQRLNYLKIAQAHDKKLIYDTVQAKNDYQNQKDIFENEKKQVVALNLQLQQYTDQLNQQKSNEQSLLAQTQGDEANYQQQLSQAQAELASFSNFVSTQGGASLLGNQTSCDSWGCYYNQRDSQWGNLVVNGSNDCGGPCTLAKIGCLITSVAMVASHYGHTNILPSDIAVSDGSNFAVGTAMLRYSISVKGVGINRSGVSRSQLDSALSSGPVIVGISYDGGPLPDHFVVLLSGSNGNYTMNDPFTPSGKEIAFTSHYSLGSIVEVDTISM